MSATATVSDPNRKHLEAARTLIAKGDLKQAALTLNKAQKHSSVRLKVEQIQLVSDGCLNGLGSVGLQGA